MFIGIDVSKLSTAMCIGDKLFSYSTEKPNNKWVKDTKDFINFRYLEYKYKSIEDYSKREISKFLEFEDVTDLIINDIMNNIKILDTTHIAIEGYSYSSDTGHIIDLVEFASLLKHKILKQIQGYSRVTIISPLALKSKSCELVYPPKIELIGKRVIKEKITIVGPTGKLGKDFDKWDMFHCFLDSNISSQLKDYLVFNKEVITVLKKLPKPFDDLIDSIFLKNVCNSLIFNEKAE